MVFLIVQCEWTRTLVQAVLAISKAIVKTCLKIAHFLQYGYVNVSLMKQFSLDNLC